MNTSKKLFTSDDHVSIDFPSAWRVAASSSSVDCQTTPELYAFEDAEMQTGPETNIVQSEVSTKFSGRSLLDFLSHTKKTHSLEEWEERIRCGNITVDMEVVTDPQYTLEEDCFIEFVDYRHDAGVSLMNYYVLMEYSMCKIEYLNYRFKRNHRRRRNRRITLRTTLIC